MINLAKQDKLAFSDINKVKQQLTQQGYYLQLSPPEEDLLVEHRKQQKLKRAGEIDKT